MLRTLAVGALSPSAGLFLSSRSKKNNNTKRTLNIESITVRVVAPRTPPCSTPTPSANDEDFYFYDLCCFVLYCSLACRVLWTDFVSYAFTFVVKLHSNASYQQISHFSTFPRGLGRVGMRWAERHLELVVCSFILSTSNSACVLRDFTVLQSLKVEYRFFV